VTRCAAVSTHRLFLRYESIAYSRRPRSTWWLRLLSLLVSSLHGMGPMGESWLAGYCYRRHRGFV
jgi:hypothetical protein